MEKMDERTLIKLMRGRKKTTQVDTELTKLDNEKLGAREDDPEKHLVTSEETTSDPPNVSIDAQATGAPVQLPSARAEPGAQRIDVGVQVEVLEGARGLHLADAEVQVDAPVPTVTLQSSAIPELEKYASTRDTSICITSAAVGSSLDTPTSTNDSAGGKAEVIEHAGEPVNADQGHIAKEEVHTGDAATSHELVAEADRTENADRLAHTDPCHISEEEHPAGVEVEDPVGQTAKKSVEANGSGETNYHVDLGGDDRAGVKAGSVSEEASQEMVVGTAASTPLSPQEAQETSLAVVGDLAVAPTIANHTGDADATKLIQVIEELRTQVEALQTENNALRAADREPGAIQYVFCHCTGCTCGPEGTGQEHDFKMDPYAIDTDEPAQPYGRYSDGSALGNDHSSFQGSQDQQYPTMMPEFQSNANLGQMSSSVYGNGLTSTSSGIPQATYMYNNASSMSWNIASQTQQSFSQPDALEDATIGHHITYAAHPPASSMSSNVTSSEGYQEHAQYIPNTTDSFEWPPTVHTLTEIDANQPLANCYDFRPESMLVDVNQGPQNHTDASNQSDVNGYLAQDNVDSAAYSSSGASTSFGGGYNPDNRPPTTGEPEVPMYSNHIVDTHQPSASFVQVEDTFWQQFTSYTLAGALGPTVADSSIMRSDGTFAVAEPSQGASLDSNIGTVCDSGITTEVSGTRDAGDNHRGGFWDAAGRAFTKLDVEGQVAIRMKFADKCFRETMSAGPFLKTREPFDWAAAEEMFNNLRGVDDEWIDGIGHMLLKGADDEDVPLLLTGPWVSSSAFSVGHNGPRDIPEESFASGSSLSDSSSRTVVGDEWLDQEGAEQKLFRDTRVTVGDQHDDLPTQPQPM